MVTGDLAAPGIRLRAEDLLALRTARPGASRAKPAARKPGAVAGKPPGAGMDLREIRAFAEGDDARRIDPAATARTGTPHVRSFHEERDDTLVLIADFRPAMLWGTGPALRSVAAARALARRGWQAIARGASVGAVTLSAGGTATVTARTGIAQMVAIARMLAAEHDAALRDAAADRLTAAGPGPTRPWRVPGALPAATGEENPPNRTLAEALARAERAAPPGAEVLVATGPDGVAAEDGPALARLARRRRVTVLLPLDPLDIAPPSAALPIRSGAAERIARLQPLDIGELRTKLSRQNISLEAFADDAG